MVPFRRGFHTSDHPRAVPCGVASHSVEHPAPGSAYACPWSDVEGRRPDVRRAGGRRTAPSAYSVPVHCYASSTMAAAVSDAMLADIAHGGAAGRCDRLLAAGEPHAAAPRSGRRFRRLLLTGVVGDALRAGARIGERLLIGRAGRVRLVLIAAARSSAMCLLRAVELALHEQKRSGGHLARCWCSLVSWMPRPWRKFWRTRRKPKESTSTALPSSKPPSRWSISETHRVTTPPFPSTTIP